MLGAAQLLTIKIRCCRHCIRQYHAARLLLGTLRRWNAVITVRHHHANTLRQILDRLNKTHAGVFNQKVDCRAVRTTAEAVIELLGGADRETGRFFVVERTQAHQIGPAFFQLHVTLHHVDNIDTVEQVLNKRLWNHREINIKDDQAPLRAALTSAETAVMSARPASLGLSTPMTLPMSCGPAAPVAATAACTSALISSSDSPAGMYVVRKTSSAFSISARSWRPPASNWLMESLRCLTILSMIASTIVSSSSTRSSTSFCFIAAVIRRIVPSLAVSLARIAAFMSSVICSFRPIAFSRDSDLFSSE